MHRESHLSRRDLLQTVGVGAVASLAVSRLEGAPAKSEHGKGNIKQSICRWCYGRIPLEKLAAEAVKIGYKSIELLTADEYKVIKPFGLTCAMFGRVSISDGFNRPEN